MATHRQYVLTAGDGLRLDGQCWLPDGEARAAVMLVHGLTEHSGRYRAPAEQLSARGYAVYAVDLRGHGRSQGPPCLVRRLDEHLADLDMLAGEVRRQQPERPVFLFGHSLGGLIATLWCIERQPVLAGLVLSAPALRLRIDLSPWLLRAAGLAGRLLPRLRIVRVGFTRVSRDPAVVASFQADPLVFHGRLPLGTVAEMLRGIRRASGRFEALRLPLVILHGTADQICAPEGSRELCRRAGSGDRTLRLYEGFGHELLGDPQLDELVADLLAWLDRRSR